MRNGVGIKIKKIQSLIRKSIHNSETFKTNEELTNVISGLNVNSSFLLPALSSTLFPLTTIVTFPESVLLFITSSYLPSSSFFVNVIFDVIGVAVQSSDTVPFHSMASKKIKTAKTAKKMLKNSAKVLYNTSKASKT